MAKSKPLRLLLLLFGLYLFICAATAIFQRSLIYHPFHATETALLARAERNGLQGLRDGNGEISAWTRRERAHRAANRLLVFHGNAGFALHRSHFVEGFEDPDGGRTWEVIIFEYPGYGARPGKISESAFIEAGLAQLNALTQGDPRPVYLLGESLGSGLACALASRAPEKIAGLLLVTPFASLTGVASQHFPFLPARLILRDRWDNLVALKTYPGPLAVWIASEDEVVGAAQGELLFAQFAGRKRIWREPGAGHNTLNYESDAPWWAETSAFLQNKPAAPTP